MVSSLGSNLTGKNSAIIASSSAKVEGDNSVILAAKMGSKITGKGSLAIGSGVIIQHAGVFAFNGKAEGGLTSQVDHTFIVDVDNGFLVKKEAATAPADRVPLQVNGAVRVGSSTVAGAIALKESGTNLKCLCLVGKGEAISSNPACNTVCGGTIAPIVTYSCIDRPPDHASLIEGDDQGLTGDTQIRLVEKDRGTAAKCEYQCNEGYHKEGDVCVSNTKQMPCKQE